MGSVQCGVSLVLPPQFFLEARLPVDYDKVLKVGLLALVPKGALRCFPVSASLNNLPSVHHAVAQWFGDVLLHSHSSSFRNCLIAGLPSIHSRDIGGLCASRFLELRIGSISYTMQSSGKNTY